MDYERDLHELCETLSEEISKANEKIKKGGGSLSAGDIEYIDNKLKEVGIEGGVEDLLKLSSDDQKQT